MAHEMLEEFDAFGESGASERDPGGGAMDFLTTVKGQTGLPRYFASVFDAAARLSCRTDAGSGSRGKPPALRRKCRW
jgi:hypothetical protein